MSLVERWTEELRRLHECRRYRTLRVPAGIDFCSNDYLGYAARSFLEVSSLPASGSSSRLLRGHHPLWDEVEAELAAWHGVEAALMMTSGYSANEGLLSTVIGPDDWVASDERNHASIIDGLRLSRAEKFIFRHQDLNHLEDGLRDASYRRGRERFIITESIFSMDGDLTPLKQLSELAARFGAHLIVDEAHATGCFGPTGAGRVDELGLRSQLLATIHTGGKALGVAGAYVCGSRLLREWLVNHCRHLIFTTALPPLLAPVWLETLRRTRTDQDGRARLHENARRFRETLRACGFAAGGDAYIVPVILGDDDRANRAADALQRRGWDVRAIRPPSVPAGSAQLRISIHADHSSDQLDALAQGIAEVVGKC